MKKNFGEIIKTFLPILMVGIFLIFFVGVNEIVEIIESKENYQSANYAPISNNLYTLSGIEMDEETSDRLLDMLISVVDEINVNNNDSVAVCISDVRTGHFRANDENDALLTQLIFKLNDGNRKITEEYSYFNKEVGSYLFLIRVNHGGIFNLLAENGIYGKLLISSLVFVVLTVFLVVFLIKKSDSGYRKIAGFLFIIIWIGTISLSSAYDLNNQHTKIANEEKQHITSLIEYYYKQDLIESDYSIEDRREFAQSFIDVFLSENGNISSIELNENYTDDRDDLVGCLNVVMDETKQKNRELEFVLSAVLFIALAIIIYDKLSERMFTVKNDSESRLSIFDKKIITIELINIVGNCFTWSLMLPRLLEVAKLTFQSNVGSVAMIYSIGIIISTATSFLSSKINKFLKNIKTYFLICFIGDLIGILAFGLIDNFILNVVAYFVVSFCDGLSGMLIYFYIAGADDEAEKDEFLVECRSTLNIGQSIGIIVGGLLGSILKYSTVLVLASVFIGISAVLVLKSKSSDYKYVENVNTLKGKINIKELLNKKHSFVFLLFIIVPLAFYDVFLDYQFPLDIIGLGFTTTVISFVSMSGRLISAYVSPILFVRMKNRYGLEKMTVIYLLGSLLLMFVYYLYSSVFMIIIATICMGVLDSFGTLSYRERFIEISKNENISEDDGNVIVKIGEKLGVSVGPSLIGLFASSVVLPITMLGSFLIYKLSDRKSE